MVVCVSRCLPRIVTWPAAADSEYWGGVGKALGLFEARATLRELHVSILEKSLAKLEQRREALKRARLAAAAASGVGVVVCIAGEGAGAMMGQGWLLGICLVSSSLSGL